MDELDCCSSSLLHVGLVDDADIGEVEGNLLCDLADLLLIADQDRISDLLCLCLCNGFHDRKILCIRHGELLRGDLIDLLQDVFK